MLWYRKSPHPRTETLWRSLGLVAPLASILCCALSQAQTALPDPHFNASVRNPAYTQEHPVVAVDEAHHNYHTMHGRYAPFAQLLQNDGYTVVAATAPFTQAALQSIRVLVVANATGGDGGAGMPAFTMEECAAVEQWVRSGGSLLLIADHRPFGSAARELALRFGVEMGQGFVADVEHSDGGDPTFLVFSEKNGLLGDSPVVHGRNAAERVRRVVAFTGQSLSIPPGAIALLKLAPTAREAATAEAALKKSADGRQDRAQGIALPLDRGRVIIVGEAALFSAQLLRQTGRPDFRFGMNAPSNDDKQFALNVLHWLSGAIP